MNKEITIAVAGNPNTGKTTFVNDVAGVRLKVGNWPGVTVEKKEASLEVDSIKVRLVDLPGTYSLSPFSMEEVIARDFLVKEMPDVVIDIVDATNLERNLYLALQIIETGRPLVIALNMYDEAQKKGFQIDVEKLKAFLGVPVVPTVAVKGEGTKEVLKTAVKVATNEVKGVGHINYGEEIERAISEIESWLKEKGVGLNYPTRWLAIKLLEKDQRVMEETGIKELPELPTVKHLLSIYGDLETALAEARYGIAAGITRECVSRKEVRPEISEKLDSILLNRYLGLPLFIVAFWLLFKFSYDISTPFIDWIDSLVSGALTITLSWLLDKLYAPSWFQSLLLDGIVAGVGAVLTFIPLIGLVMFFITFLEGCGYMARAAFVMDRIMHSVGLHGKSFIPLLLGFGCNVPSIQATRALESERDRVLTAILCPFMSCGARLPIYIVLAGALFSAHVGTVIWSLYMLGIVVAILVGLILQRFKYFKQEPALFVMELPPYRLPGIKYLLIYTWDKLKPFVIKAGTVIVAISIITWGLLNLPPGAEKKDCYLAKIGKVIAPVFKPLGFGNWEATASLFTGFLAKEIVVATMGEIYGIGGEKKETPSLKDAWMEVIKGFPLAFVNAGKNLISAIYPVSLAPEEAEPSLLAKIREVFTPLSAYAFMAFALLYVPCMVFIANFYAEFRSLRLLGLLLLVEFSSAYIVALLIYQVGRLLGLGV